MRRGTKRPASDPTGVRMYRYRYVEARSMRCLGHCQTNNPASRLRPLRRLDSPPLLIGASARGCLFHWKLRYSTHRFRQCFIGVGRMTITKRKHHIPSSPSVQIMNHRASSVLRVLVILFNWFIMHKGPPALAEDSYKLASKSFIRILH